MESWHGVVKALYQQLNRIWFEKYGLTFRLPFTMTFSRWMFVVCLEVTLRFLMNDWMFPGLDDISWPQDRSFEIYKRDLPRFGDIMLGHILNLWHKRLEKLILSDFCFSSRGRNLNLLTFRYTRCGCNAVRSFHLVSLIPNDPSTRKLSACIIVPWSSFWGAK